MSRFVTELDVRLKDNGWILDSALVYYSDLLGEYIEVPKGFATDYASVPRLPLAYALFGNTNHKAAVLHDYLYTTKPSSRKTADRIFLEAAKASGQPFFRRWMMYLGVRLGGGLAWKENRNE